MICAVVLAAGRSERMGTQKLLLPVGGKLVITQIVDELIQSPVAEIIVVVGGDGDQIRRALNGRQVRFVVNASPGSDMLGSIRFGLRALPAECQAALIVLGDQPNVSAGLVSRLIDVFRKSDRSIVAPSYGGHRGHPLLIGTGFRDELMTQHTAVGLRGLLAAHPGEVLCVEVENAAVLADMDTPADYQRLLSSAAD